MDREAYLRRIGFCGGREPNAASLVALVRAHRLAVPYETLDLWRRRRTTLQLEEIYGKIVVRRRGGYCFELNGLFAWLLRELGYNVREYFGRWTSSRLAARSVQGLRALPRGQRQGRQPVQVRKNRYNRARELTNMTTMAIASQNLRR